MHARCIREMLSTLPVRGVRMSNKDRLLLRTVAAALNEMAANSCGGPDGDDADEDDDSDYDNGDADDDDDRCV
eukprot:43407-Eustigmatos_ZCMA.PRE.1